MEPKHLNVDDFIKSQLKIIAEDGFDEYLPVLWVDTPDEIIVNVLSDPPEGDELALLVREWTLQMAGKHDYLLAFKADHAHLKVVVRVGAKREERIVAIT